MFYLTTHSTHRTYTRKEGDVLFNNALNTFQHILLTLGRKEMFYFTTHSTHFNTFYLHSEGRRCFILQRTQHISTHFTYTWKEGDVLFYDALNTFQHILLTLGRKEMFYLTTHSTHFNTFYLHLEGRRCFILRRTQHISTHFTYTWKEGDVLFNNALNTFQHILLTLGRKEMFYLTTHSTHPTYTRKEGDVLFNDALNTSYLHSEGRRCFI